LIGRVQFVIGGESISRMFVVGNMSIVVMKSSIVAAKLASADSD
jgi:hypothetical protein